MQFKIANESGLTGPAWDATYPTLHAAAEALGSAMGWPSIVLDGADGGSYFYAYSTAGEAAADILRFGAARITMFEPRWVESETGWTRVKGGRSEAHLTRLDVSTWGISWHTSCCLAWLRVTEDQADLAFADEVLAGAAHERNFTARTLNQ